MRKIMTIIALCLATCTLWAQNEVSLVVSGEGKDKEEATFKALRNAVEQAYGTFVSANTTVLNDQLMADEIVSLSSGNIQKYEYVSENKMPNGNSFVTLSATVSIDKLVSFAESKGMEAELKGGLFAMNIKKMEFDKKAEEKAVENLCKQLEATLPTLYDYEIKVKEPKIADGGLYAVNYYVAAKPNENMIYLIDVLHRTLESLSLSESERKKYSDAGTRVSYLSTYNFYNHTFLLSLDGFRIMRSYSGNLYIPLEKLEDVDLFKRKCEYWSIPFSKDIPSQTIRLGEEKQSYYLRSEHSVDVVKDFLNNGLNEMFNNIYVEDNIRKIKIPSFKNTCDKFNQVQGKNFEFISYGSDWCDRWPSSPYFHRDSSYGLLNRYLQDRRNDNLVEYAIFSGRILYTLNEISQVTSISVGKLTDKDLNYIEIPVDNTEATPYIINSGSKSR